MKMKKTTYLLLLFSVLFISCERDINVNPNLDYSYSIADNALRAYLVEEEYIEVDELNKTISLTEKGENLRTLELERLDIYSIEGLSIFENLSTLLITSSKIKEVKISGKLQKLDSVDIELALSLDHLEVAPESNIAYLRISESRLTSLDISDLTSLTKLALSQSPITSLILPKESKIKELTIGYTYLETLDLSKQYDLELLVACENYLQELDLSKNTKLESFDVSSNRLTNLVLPKANLLANIYCFDNQLSELDLSGNTNISYIDCSKNQLRELGLSGNTNASSINCSENQLRKLDLSESPNLLQLICNDNQLNELDLSKNEDLYYLFCYENQISELDLRANFLNESDDYALYCGNQYDNEGNNYKNVELKLGQSSILHWTEKLSTHIYNVNVTLMEN